MLYFVMAYEANQNYASILEASSEEDAFEKMASAMDMRHVSIPSEMLKDEEHGDWSVLVSEHSPPIPTIIDVIDKFEEFHNFWTLTASPIVLVRVFDPEI